MKRLLIALFTMFTLGLSAPAAQANSYIDYPDGNWSEVYALGWGVLLFIFFNWQGVTRQSAFLFHPL